jgi:YggT family protein
MIICRLVNLYLLLMFGRIILSWFPLSPGSVMASVYGFLYGITEPVLGPVRRVLPPLSFGGAGLDLSPIVVLLLVQVVVLPIVC